MLNHAGLQSSRDELQRSEDLELMTINAEIDQAIRNSDIEIQIDWRSDRAPRLQPARSKNAIKIGSESESDMITAYFHVENAVFKH